MCIPDFFVQSFESVTFHFLCLLYFPVAALKVVVIELKGQRLVWKHLLFETLSGVNLLLEQRQGGLVGLKRLSLQIDGLGHLLVVVVA